MPAYSACLAELQTLVSNLQAFPDRNGPAVAYTRTLCSQKLNEAKTALTGVVDENASALYVFSIISVGVY